MELTDADLITRVLVDDDQHAFGELVRRHQSAVRVQQEMLTVLTRVFNTPVEGLFGDLIRGKHGGVVILAAGRPDIEPLKMIPTSTTTGMRRSMAAMAIALR